MEIPWTGLGASDVTKFRLCVQAGCHDTNAVTKFTTTDTNYTNLITDGVNRHEYHLNLSNQNRYYADYNFGGTINSRINCVICHNVHGSTQLAMVRDGKLIDREPGQKIWYNNDAIVTYETTNPDPPDPEDLPLSASTGTLWRPLTAGNLCSHCHANNNTLPEYRDPYQDVSQAPTLDWTGETNYESDGVNPDSGPGASSFRFRVKYTDINNDAPVFIEVWIDLNDDGDYNDDGEKLSMNEVTASDTNYVDGKLYYRTETLSKTGDGNLNYRFYASDGALATGPPTDDSSVIVFNAIPTLAWTGETYFVSDGVNPDTGGIGSNYDFRITYTDPDHACPVSGSSNIQVWIDEDNNGYDDPGERYNMIEDSAADTDCTDGKIYKVTRALSTAGTHNYRFYASDSFDYATGTPTSDSSVTVMSTANNLPYLEWATADCLADGVRPQTGDINTDFEFMVRYIDEDNECPLSGTSDIQVWIDGGTEQVNMTEVDGDADCTSVGGGKLYKLDKSFSSAATETYRFYATDGTSDATGAPTSDNTISVIDAFRVRPTGGEYSTIGAAVTASTDPSTILVYPNADFTAATYSENISVSNKNNRTIQSACGADLTIVSSSSTGHTVTVQDSSYFVMDGFSVTGATFDGVTGGFYINRTNATTATIKNSKIYLNSNGIYVTAAQDEPVEIDNVEIYNNSVTGIKLVNGDDDANISNSEIHSNNVGANSGAAMNISNATATITNTIIRNNTTTGLGGAIYNNGAGADLTIENSTIYENQAGTGGVLYLATSASADISRSTIRDNTSTGEGGVVYTNGCDVTIENSIFADNEGSNGGVISSFNGPTITMVNSTFADNTATNRGGVIHICQPGNHTVRNSIFWGNTATSDGVIAYKDCGFYSGFMTITDSDVDTSGSNFGNGTPTTSNNIDPAEDPLFIDPAGDNYHIEALSPVIDQANATYAPADDIDGDARPVGAGDDMGADEITSIAPVLAWTGEANYTSDGIDPDTASSGTTFTFRVDYTDANNNAPVLIQVWINEDNNGAYSAGEKFTMTEVDGGDTDYTDGKLYTLSRALTYEGGGTLNHRFYASDGSSEATGAPMAEQSVTLTNNIPTLSWTGEANYASDGVNPDSSTGGTSYEFRIDYTDGDNTAPSPIQVWIDEDDSGTYEPGEQYPMNPVDGDSDYTDGKRYNYSKVLNFAGDGNLNYRFYASDGTDDATGTLASDATVTVTNNIPTLAWTGEAGYTTDGVDPDSSTSGSTFTFRVDYTDGDNKAPSPIQVWIDENDNDIYEDPDERYTLTETDGGDTDYTDGKRYSVARVLAYTNDGIYNYRFYASDGTANATGIPTSNSTVTVTDVANNAPTLDWTTADCLNDGARPSRGDQTIDFEFMVSYTDSDNQAPTSIQVWIDRDDNGNYLGGGEKITMTKAAGEDGDYTNGEIYEATGISLASPALDDDLNYLFYATDGVDDATGDPTSAEAVTVVDGVAITPGGGTTIDQALDNTANNGKHIIVYPESDFTTATYGEKITTNSSSADNVTLMSACGADFTIIDNTVDNSTAFFVQDVSYMVIDGFSITGASSGSGVDINRVDNTDFTIRNSRIYGNATGIYLSSGQSRPIYIENNEIYSNTTRGIYLPNSLANDVRILSSEIHSNSVGANPGAAIYMNSGSAATISKSIIRDNTTTGEGGAIFTNAANLTIENSIFADNQGSNGGVIRTNNGPTVTVVNSTFADNSATNQGGVFYICATGTTTVRNSIFWNNSATSSGHIAYKACSGIFHGFMTITDSDVDTDPPDVYNYFGNGTPTTSNNIDPAQDPLFVNATADNYHIQTGSPVIDQASATYAPDDDIDGDSRPIGAADDMGADEKE
jgi:hypothetical protein